MAKRVNIYLPDDLVQRLQPFRDRVNVSRVAAEALEKLIEDLEIDAALAAIRTRIREQAPAEIAERTEFYQRGFQDRLNDSVEGRARIMMTPKLDQTEINVRLNEYLLGWSDADKRLVRALHEAVDSVKETRK